MAKLNEVPVDRYALIAEIVRRFNSTQDRLGKTALQKVIFLLQRVFGVEVDYSYTLYTYGPFCSDVARDLDVVNAIDGVKILPVGSGGGFEIVPGPMNAEVCGMSASFLRETSSALDKVIENFGGLTAKELELRSTLVYLSKPDLSRRELIHQVNEIKPHFSPETIKNALLQLEERNFIPNLEF